MTLGINDIQHNETQHIPVLSVMLSYAECRDYLNAILSVVMLNVVMQIVVAPVTGLTRKYGAISNTLA